MRTEKIGKRQFAFDLKWDMFGGDDAAETVRDQLDEDAQGYFVVVRKADPKPVAGIGARLRAMRRGGPGTTEQSDKSKSTSMLGYAESAAKAPVYSYAEALTKLGRDGIYVLPAADGKFWIAVIADGLVAPGTDQTLKEDAAYDKVSLFQSTLNVPVYSSTDLIRGSLEFDAERAVERLKLTPMRQIGKGENKLLGVIALAAVLGGIGFGAWYMFFKDKRSGVDQAQLAAQQRTAYLTQAKAAIDAVPTEAVWASEAFRSASTYFAPRIGGWQLSGFTCSPGSCTGTYSLPSGAAYAVTPVYDHYGRANVTVLGDNQGLNVALQLDGAESVPATDEDVESPALTAIPVLDTVGSIGLFFSDVSVDGEVKSETLNGAMAAPAALPSLIRETVALKHESSMDLVKMRLLSAYMAKSGFVATTLTVSGGAGALAPAWRIEWVRFHGGEA